MSAINSYMMRWGVNMFFRLTRVGDWRLNLVLRLGSFWVGVHRSSAYDSICIAVLPCVVLQFIKNDSVPLDCKVGEKYEN